MFAEAVCVVQVFQDHMSGREHLRKLQDITQSIQLNAGPLLDRCGLAGFNEALMSRTCSNSVHLQGSPATGAALV